MQVIPTRLIKAKGSKLVQKRGAKYLVFQEEHPIYQYVTVSSKTDFYQQVKQQSKQQSKLEPTFWQELTDYFENGWVVEEIVNMVQHNYPDRIYYVLKKELKPDCDNED